MKEPSTSEGIPITKQEPLELCYRVTLWSTVKRQVLPLEDEEEKAGNVHVKPGEWFALHKCAYISQSCLSNDCRNSLGDRRKRRFADCSVGRYCNQFRESIMLTVHKFSDPRERGAFIIVQA